MKSTKYSQATVQQLLGRLDGVTMLRELGVQSADYAVSEEGIRAYCPICGERSRMTLTIGDEPAQVNCSNPECQANRANSGASNLLEFYALANGTLFDQAVERFAGSLGVPLTSPTEDLERQRNGQENEYNYREVGHSRQAGDHDLQPAEFSWAGQSGVGRGVYVRSDDVDRFVEHFKANVFVSHFAYERGSRIENEQLAAEGKLSVLDNYYVVFNSSSSAEIVHAINQAIDLVERLKENYDVPYEAVTVYYTNRNITVHADYPVFGVMPSPELPEIYRRMTCAVIGVDPLQPERSQAFSQIDLSVYRWDYMHHIPGSRITANGQDIYKIRMSYNAFKKMSYQRLHEFSLRRPDLPPRDLWQLRSKKASEFFDTARSSLQRDMRQDSSDTIASLFYNVTADSSEITTLKSLAPTLLKRLFDESRQVLSTGHTHLDRAFSGGMQPGQLYILAGYPGSGTSTLALQLMNQAADSQNAQCMFVGFQRGVEEIFKRSLAYLGKITLSEIDEKRQHPRELYEDKDFNQRIFSAFEKYQRFADNITILEGAAASNLSMLQRQIQERKEELKSDLSRGSGMMLVIDSLQLMVAMMRSMVAERRHDDLAVGNGHFGWEVETLTSRLKALAREQDIVVLATLEYYGSRYSLSSEQGEHVGEHEDLLHITQFSDAVMELTRQGSTLTRLKDFYRTHLSGTPRESTLQPILHRMEEIEAEHVRNDEFRNMTSEFAVLDIIKNRSGAREKVLYNYRKAVSTFEPVNYIPNNMIY